MRGQLKAWGSWPAESCPRPFPHRPPSGKRTPSSTKHHTQKPNFEVPMLPDTAGICNPNFVLWRRRGRGTPWPPLAPPPLFPIHTLFIKFTIIYLHPAHVGSSIFLLLTYLILFRAILLQTVLPSLARFFGQNTHFVSCTNKTT